MFILPFLNPVKPYMATKLPLRQLYNTCMLSWPSIVTEKCVRRRGEEMKTQGPNMRCRIREEVLELFI